MSKYLQKWQAITTILVGIVSSGTGYLVYVWQKESSEVVARHQITELIIDAKKREIEAQTKLQATKEAGIDDIYDFMQQLVNTYKTPAWVKYLDFMDQKFKYVVTNPQYSSVYNTPPIPRGETDQSLYAGVDLTPLQRSALSEYATNDYKSLQIGFGRCLDVMEPAFPNPGDNKIVKYWFRKCMLKHGSQTYVLGYQL